MDGPVVLITGCTKGGIGSALCEQFVKHGCRVFATARRVESMDDSMGCTLLALDITDLESIKNTIQTVQDQAGHIDILVNNAGCPAVGALLDIDMNQARVCVETNVFGTLSMCQHVGRLMAERGSGKIVNVGSIVGYVATPWAAVYSMSKAAVHSMTDGLRLELAPFGVQVILVAPGAIVSNFGKASSNAVSLPEGSLYTSVTNLIVGRANLSQGPRSTPTDVFAAKVTKDILRRHPQRYVTFGADSTVMLILYYLPVVVKDYFLSYFLGVNQVKKVAKD